MAYKVEFTPQAEKDLLSLDKSVAGNIANKIEWFSQNFESTVPAPLKGGLKGKYKLRAGDWRVIYSIEHDCRIITVYAVRHRSDIYKI